VLTRVVVSNKNVKTD